MRRRRLQGRGDFALVPSADRPFRLRKRRLPPLDQVQLHALRIDQLREAVRSNGVSFPSPVPTFDRHDRADLQWKLVQLYFVLGWRCDRIASRYRLSDQRVRQILKTWKRRAVEMGYVQSIPPDESLLALAMSQPVSVPNFVFLAPSAASPNTTLADA